MTRKAQICVDEKLKIIARMKAGESLNTLEKDTGYQRSQIKRWIKQENELLAAKGNAKRVSGGGRKPSYDKLEAAIVKWFCEKRAKKLVFTYLTIREKAKRFVEMFPEGYMDFVCSDHWIRNVCRRHNICREQ